MIPTQEQIDKMSPAEKTQTMKTMKAFQEELEVEKMIFPAFFKKEQEEFNAYYKIVSKTAGLRIDAGITPLIHDSDIRRIAEMSLKGEIKECSSDEFYNAQAIAQDRINSLLIK